MSLNNVHILSKLEETNSFRTFKCRIDSIPYLLYQFNAARIGKLEALSKINQIYARFRIRSPSILKLKTVFYDNFTDSLCVALEYPLYGTLAGKIEKTKEHLPEPTIAAILKQLVTALKDFHREGICLSALSIQDIFCFPQDTVKLNPFNLSFAKEIGLVQGSTPSSSLSADLKALGKILYKLIHLSE